MAAPTITRTAWTDDDGTGLTGTVINNAEKTTLYGQIDTLAATLYTVAGGGTGVSTLAAHGVVIGEGTSAVAVTGAGTAGQVLTSNGASADPTFQAPSSAAVVQTTTSTGTQNDLTLTTGVTLLRCNNATLLTINGFAAGTDGQRVVVESVGAGIVSFAHQNAGSATANRLINFATSAATSLAAGVGTAEFVYDLTTARWKMVEHTQGDWITVAYAGGNFTASAGTWTVDSGDVTTCAYYLTGRMLFVNISLGTTSVSATPAQLIVGLAALGGFTTATLTYSIGHVFDAGVFVTANPFASTLGVYFTRLDGNSFATSTNATYARCNFGYPVT